MKKPVSHVSYYFTKIMRYIYLTKTNEYGIFFLYKLRNRELFNRMSYNLIINANQGLNLIPKMVHFRTALYNLKERFYNIL